MTAIANLLCWLQLLGTTSSQTFISVAGYHITEMETEIFQIFHQQS